MSVGLFSRVTLDLGWYDRKTEDALLDVPIPASNGFTTLKRNIGVLSNSGVEASVNTKIIDRNDFRFNLRFSLAYNRNKVMDLYDGDRLYTSEDAIIPDYEVGQAYDMIYGPISLGLDPMSGLPVFKGADGREIQATEKLKREDMVPLGHSVPPFNGTINLSFTCQGSTAAEKVSFAYDAATGKYLRYQDGAKHVDSETGAQLAFTNVVTLITSVECVETGIANDPYMTLVETKNLNGLGYYFHNGKVIQIKWYSDGNNLTLIDALGNDLTLATGNTYIGYLDSALVANGQFWN
jgi:hypothetical protein